MAMKIIEVETGQNTYWKVFVRGNWKEIDEAEVWCSRNQCGKKIAISQFAFKSEAEMTMFRLRWENE